ncbi:MAG: hypothetical protein ABI639_08835 [Thermoanaerobaculia bacterium]
MERVTGELEATREQFATELDDLRGTLHEELGLRALGRRWIVPIVAIAVGVVAGVALRRNLPRPRRVRRALAAASRPRRTS